MTKRRMDKIISLYEKERIDPSAFHGVNGIIIIYSIDLLSMSNMLFFI